MWCAEWCTDQHFWRVVSWTYRHGQRDHTTNSRRFLYDISPLRRGDQSTGRAKKV